MSSVRPGKTMRVEDVLGGALARQFDALDASVGGAFLLQAALDGAEVIRAEAERLAPRGAVSKRTRRSKPLHKNIVKSAFLATQKTAKIDVGFNKDAFHGRFLELGTPKMAARPWLRPAFDAKKAEAQRVFSESLRRRILGGQG